MPVPVDPIRYLPKSNDDAQFKRDQIRFSQDVSAEIEALWSAIENLQKRVN